MGVLGELEVIREHLSMLSMLAIASSGMGVTWDTNLSLLKAGIDLLLCKLIRPTIFSWWSVGHEVCSVSDYMVNRVPVQYFLDRGMLEGLLWLVRYELKRDGDITSSKLIGSTYKTWHLLSNSFNTSCLMNCQITWDLGSYEIRKYWEV